MWFDRNINGNRDVKFLESDYLLLQWFMKFTQLEINQAIQQPCEADYSTGVDHLDVVKVPSTLIQFMHLFGFHNIKVIYKTVRRKVGPFTHPDIHSTVHCSKHL